MRIAIASDHRGVEFKKGLYDYLTEKGLEVNDYSPVNSESDDYPDYANAVGWSIVNNESDKGILICGTGIGMSIAANKIKGIYCGRVVTPADAKLARSHNGVNVITLDSDSNDLDYLKQIVDAFLTTDSLDAQRHERRYKKIIEIEKQEYNGL